MLIKPFGGRNADTEAEGGFPKVVRLMCKAVIALTIVFTLIAAVGAVFAVDHKYGDALLLGDNGTYKVLFCLGALFVVPAGAFGLIKLWSYLYRLTERASRKQLWAISGAFFGLFLLACILLCVFVNPKPFNDSLKVQNMAYKMASQSSLHITTETVYFQKYSNNDLLTILLSLLFRVYIKLGVSNSQVYQLSLFMNTAAIVFAEVLVFMGVKRLWGLKNACRYSILACMQPCIALSSVWAYTNTLCLPLMCGQFCIMAYGLKTGKRWVKVVLGCLFGVITAFGYFIRPTVLIGGMAFAVAAFVYAVIQRRRLKSLLACVLVGVVLFGGSFTALQKLVDTYGGDNSKNLPITHWVMMGLHGNGIYTNEDVGFTESRPTYDEKKEANIEEIKRALKEDYNVFTLVGHGLKKHFITWCDGSADYDLRLRYVSNDNLVTKTLRYGGLPIAIYCQMYRVALLVLAAAAMWFMLRKNIIGPALIPVIVLFGGMLFYFLWEVKSSYSIPFLYCFVILAVIGLSWVQPLKPFKRKE